MTWTAKEWEGFCLLVEEDLAGAFTDARRMVWKLRLDDVEPAVADAALKMVLRTGEELRLRKVMAAIDEQRTGGVPSFDEAWPVLYRAMSGFNPYDDASPARVIGYARQHAGDVAAGWLAAYTPARLASEPVDDPEYGGAILHRLRAHYTELAASPGGRDRLVRALDAPARRGELHRFDPAGLLETNHRA